ncbi:MAG: glycosyltransferase [Anaerolineae bacterium]|jgi:D-inositol-3-phosphate glycosyltransferase|nr:glycosyltransferase [Anaerolineae bacterium]MBT3712580.1 glycosyltransferase [Anaerolineae bacterium]MBT4311994.1 glycosyltransferase [Anaerolineae bacterium]MBT4458142.1 glycosyltransferase [Anaerolineae bacterium]MBT4841897.1 glycosyltransferase [Anaerolineae bacterium]
MLRIAMLSYHTCPLATLGGKDTGGMNVYVRDLTRQLGRMGVHVDVFTRSQDEHVPHVLHDLGSGNRVVHIPAGNEVPLPKQALVEHIPDFVDGILKFTEEKDLKYDVIHSHYWMSGIAAGILKDAWGIPIVHMFHTLGAMKNRIARSDEEREGPYRVDGEKQVLSRADRLIVATPAEKSQLQFLYQADVAKMVIIPPGVDTEHFYPIPKDEARDYIGVSGDDCMALFVGRIEPLKGIDTLMKAVSVMGMYDAENPFYVAIIGGDPNVAREDMTEEMARLQNLCDELCLGQMALFLGKRAQDTLPYYYSAAEVLLMPSHYESFGMVALEAMACGTPVIASQVGGLAYLVKDGETGYHVPFDSPDVLSEKLGALLGDFQLRKKMGEQAAIHAKGYDWEVVAGRIIDVYRELQERQGEEKKQGVYR